jgi:molecular chaperone DnaK
LPQIDVEFNLDANGILNVGATDKGTGKSQKIEIKGSSGLDKSEIERMKKDAEAHADEDKKRRELVDLRNRGETTVYQYRKQLEELGDKVPAEVRGKIESAMSNVEARLKEDDGEALKRAMEELDKVAQEMGKAAYESAGQGGAGEAGPQGPGGEQAAGSGGSGGSGKKASGDDVIDAEFEVKE